MDTAGSVARVLRGLALSNNPSKTGSTTQGASAGKPPPPVLGKTSDRLSLIHISEPTRLDVI
eukprot:3143821-Prorocentrum_lima.AAC.1